MTVVRKKLVTICLGAMALTGCMGDRNNGPKPPDAHVDSESGSKAAPTPGGKSDPAVVGSSAGLSDSRPIIVAYGDSLSAGYGADPGKSYPDYLQKLIDHAGKNYHVYNAGVSGDTTTDGLERLPGILTLKPKFAILELGGNDGLRGIQPPITKANLGKMIAALQGAGTKVILAGMTLPRNYGPDYIHRFEQIYVELADQYRLTRIPFLLNGVATDKNLMQADSIHPTAQGNEKVAQTVFGYVNPMLTEKVK
jgi:acyl-CoA thioesterase-1